MSGTKVLKVVVAEDDAIVSRSIQNQLTRLGFQVIGTAYDGEEALAQVRQFKPDAVLMDMRMPDSETGMEDPQAGLTATRAILEHCPTPVVLLTAFESPELIQQATNAGVSAYLLKPVKDNDLDRAIHVAVARFSESQRLQRLNEQLAQVNDELRRSEAQFRILSDAAPVGVLKADANGLLTYLSPAWSQITGRPVASLLGDGLLMLLSKEDRQRLRENLERGFRLNQTWEDTFQIRRLTGEPRFVRVHCAPILDASGHTMAVVGVGDDITDRRRARELREQAQRREGLSILAGGIAHDFNNLLTAIQGYLELAMLQTSESCSIRRYHAGIQDAVQRASELARQMLAFAGRQTIELETLDLNRLLSTLLPTLSSLLPPGATLEVDQGTDLPSIRGDLLQLQQVVHSLVMNAAEALTNQQGTIWLRTGCERLERADLDREFPDMVLEIGTYVFLTVQDDGCGMDQDTQLKIFDPFFSTKFMGRGLGLPATHGILQAHGAPLRVKSAPGAGSSFTMFFPALADWITAELPAEPVAEPLPERPAQARILLVDDEEALRESIAEYLQILGHEVIEAKDGLEAVERFKASPHRFDLVIMDLTMPRMNGHEAFEAIRTLKPDVRVILSSGYTEEDATRQFVGAGLAAFLQKPYTLKELESLLVRVLSA